MENTSLESYSEYIDKDILDSFKNFLASNDIETLNSEENINNPRKEKYNIDKELFFR